jgi:hypothetical protein
MLCYARMQGGEIASLHPAILSRGMHETSMADTIHGSLRPASGKTQLSVADLLFGWVATTEGDGEFRSRVSVSPIRAELQAEESVDANGQPIWLPLEVLLAPKNAPRFAGSPDWSGRAHGRGDRSSISWGRSTGIDTYNTIRGHKMWVTPTGPELRGPVANNEKRQDKVNRSINGWFREGSFRLTLRVKDVTPLELGALLWLFQQGSEGSSEIRYRIGLGKSLGFGSTSPHIESMKLSTTEQLREFWRNLDHNEPELTDDVTLMACMATFTAAMNATFKGVLPAFDKLRRGYDDGYPLIPPRSTQFRDERSTVWSANNEARPAHRETLDAATSNDGLPFYL